MINAEAVSKPPIFDKAQHPPKSPRPSAANREPEIDRDTHTVSCAPSAVRSLSDRGQACVVSSRSDVTEENA